MHGPSSDQRNSYALFVVCVAIYSAPIANFSQNEIGTPIMDTVLEPGDLLYFPRGTIHQVLCVHTIAATHSLSTVFCVQQAMSLPDCHSLHVTLSTYQKNTWGDLLERVRMDVDVQW